MANPWLERRVLAYAHQGGAREAPSSTLFAIERALTLGVDGIELDVHATGDGAPIVCHDATLDRTTNGSGPIADKSLRELAALDNAFHFVPGEDAQPGREAASYPLRGLAPSDRRYGIATLEEVLEACRDCLLNLDIKQCAPLVPAYEASLAAALSAADRVDGVIVTSFYDQATEAFHALAPDVATAPGLNEATAFVQAVRSGGRPDPAISRHAALQVPAWFGSEPLVDARFVEVAHDCGLAVHAWTVDEPTEMERLVTVGVDGIMTDRPSILLEQLARLGLSWRRA